MAFHIIFFHSTFGKNKTIQGNALTYQWAGGTPATLIDMQNNQGWTFFPTSQSQREFTDMSLIQIKGLQLMDDLIEFFGRLVGIETTRVERLLPHTSINQ